jgi:glycosyltransferase involved in cell wall biosynthesis
VSLGKLKTCGFDVLHPTYYDPYFLEPLGDRPFVLTIHDMTHELHPEGLSDRAILPGRKRLLARRARRIVAVSENTRQDAIRLLNLDPAKVVTIPHGNSLRPGLVEPVAAKAAPGYWLYVGSRSAYKNWSLVVQALAQRHDPEDRLVMVGGGPLTKEEQASLEAAGLARRSLQTSATDGELAGWYQQARALVYPSLYEGFGMPLLEAMAWGCPVVSARSSCLPEVGGEAALYFDPASLQELVLKLAEVERPEVARGLVSAGRQRESGYRWDRTVQATAVVYQECL